MVGGDGWDHAAGGRRHLALLVISGGLAACVIVLLTLQLWGLRPWGDAVDYQRFGTWSDALAGIGSTLTAAIAVAAVLVDRAFRRRASEQAKVQGETAVYVWLRPTEVRSRSTGERTLLMWHLRVQNLTSTPVYHWKVELGDAYPDECSLVRGPLLPGETDYNVRSLDNIEVTNSPKPGIVFQSRAGRYWCRSEGGTLGAAEPEDLTCPHLAGAQIHGGN